MVTQNVKEYFLINRRGTPQGIADDLCEDIDEVESAIEFWLSKGKLVKMGSSSSCAGCSSSCSDCSTAAAPDVYEWRG